LQWQTPSRGNIEQQRIFPRLANQDDWIRFSRPYQNGLIMGEYGITGDLLSAGDGLADTQNQRSKTVSIKSVKVGVWTCSGQNPRPAFAPATGQPTPK
jgi:hypothetical protein